MKIVKLTPNKPCQVIEIENSLKALQKEVEGYIEVLRVSEREVLIVNEEGKIKNLPLCLIVKSNYGNDAIFGNILFAEVTKSGNFKSLPEKSINALLDNFYLKTFRYLDLS